MPTLRRVLCDDPPAAEDEQKCNSNNHNAASAAVVGIGDHDVGTENCAKLQVENRSVLGESSNKKLNKAKDRHIMKVDSIKTKANSRVKKNKKAKDRNAPKHAKSAYNYYQAETHPQIKVEFPGISFADLNKTSGERWGNLLPDQKKKFQEMAAADRDRYHVETEVHQSKMMKAAAAPCATKSDPVTSNLEKGHVSTSVTMTEDNSLSAGGRKNDQDNNDIEPDRSNAPRASSLCAPSEILPLHLERCVSTSFSKPSTIESRSKTSEGSAKESWRLSCDAILNDLEVLKGTPSKSLPQAGDVDSKTMPDLHASNPASESENDDIWTCGLSSSRKKMKRHGGSHESSAEAATAANVAAKVNDCHPDMRESSKSSLMIFETDKSTSKNDKCDAPQSEGDNIQNGCHHKVDDAANDGIEVSIEPSLQINVDSSISSKVNESSFEQSNETAVESTTYWHWRGSLSPGREEGDKENSLHLLATSDSPKMLHRSPIVAKPILKSGTLIILVPLTPMECRSILKSKNLPWDDEYVVPDGKDVFTRNTIELCYREHNMKTLPLSRNAYTGIKSMLISRSLCEVSLSCTGGEPVASVLVHKSPNHHAVHLDGRKINSTGRCPLNSGAVLSLYGPLGYAYEVRIST
ncbi:hypothetical protein HJC23_007758 [Cyclotella cryptica]|uniref:HMG box domain-containing protein n=1 Tax=Cyclotella cryptica TaxID=29204 RepID=A0ABD3QZL8_9STRA|eukprot:CCRYP_000011-RA/>CCRYP_000011-RA protein AED:0.07 eAED:0.72 QI:0/-1/0/1/-1/1/1/0/635